MGKIKMIYVTSARYLMMISFPIAALGIALAHPIIHLLFGAEYASSVILMQIAFIPFALRGLNYAVSSIIYGVKEPAYLLKIGVILVIMSIGLNFWLIPIYGAIGAVIATSIPRVIALPLYIRFVSRRIEASWPIGESARIILAALLMGLMVFLIQHYLSDIPSLCLGIPVGIIVFIAALLIMRLVKPQDLKMLKKIEGHLPSVIRSGYAAVLNLAGKFVKEE
jgi:O-antigen/teichoic acid export membrane protein